MQLCCAVTVSFTATLLVNNPLTVLGTNKLVLYQLSMNCIITKEQLANIENQYLSKNTAAGNIVCMKKQLNPPPAALTKTFIFINDSPRTLLFIDGYVFFRVAFIFLSQQPGCHRFLTGRIIETFFPLSLNERGGYKNYNDPRRCSILGVWILFI